MKIYTLFVAFTFVLLACNNNSPTSVNKSTTEESTEQNMNISQEEKDADFLVKIADGNMLEVEMGILSQTSAFSPEVKGFGEMMIGHHTKMLTELRSLATSKGVGLPTVLSDAGKEQVNDLLNEQGKDFDEDYMEVMVADHKKDIREFEDKLKDDKCDQDIKNWLNQNLPLLKSHLQKAEVINKTVED